MDEKRTDRMEGRIMALEREVAVLTTRVDTISSSVRDEEKRRAGCRAECEKTKKTVFDRLNCKARKITALETAKQERDNHENGVPIRETSNWTWWMMVSTFLMVALMVCLEFAKLLYAIPK